MFEDFGPNQCLAVSVLLRTCFKLTHQEMRKFAVPFLSFCVSQAHYAHIEDEAGPQKRSRPKQVRFAENYSYTCLDRPSEASHYP